MSIETKADIGADMGVGSGDLRAAMRDFLGAFEEFKAANDVRLDSLEKKRGEDVLVTDKIDRLNAALDEQKAAIDRVALRQRRPALGIDGRGGDECASGAPDAVKAAFDRYMRAGEAGLLATPESKALNVGADAEGGYLAPETTERVINAAVRDISPIRQIASVREVGVNAFKKPVSLGGAAAGWVGETGGRIETAAPTLSSIDFPTQELYAMPAASQTLLDDAVVDIEQWLADEVQAEFAAQETAAFVAGDGVAQPRGFLSYTAAPEATRQPEEIGYVATGVDGDFPASNPSDILLDLIYTPKQAHRANGRFVMNRALVGTVRKFKDADGNYLWQPALEAGAPSTLMGFPVTEAEDMPGAAAGATPIAFGDFRRFYLIVDRQGVRILRDPYSAKPYVLFYTTKRVGGGVQDFDAVKLLKFSAS